MYPVKSILLFTKTNSGGTEKVWFYDMQADGWSLDDKREPLLDFNKLGTNPSKPLSKEDHDKNNLPDIIKRWKNIAKIEKNKKRTDQSFFIDLISNN